MFTDYDLLKLYDFLRIIFDNISCIISVEDESGTKVIDVGGVTALDNASLQLNPVQSIWQSSWVDSFTDAQFQGDWRGASQRREEEPESQSRGEKASGEISKQERAQRRAKKMREDGKKDYNLRK